MRKNGDKILFRRQKYANRRLLYQLRSYEGRTHCEENKINNGHRNYVLDRYRLFYFIIIIIIFFFAN